MISAACTFVVNSIFCFSSYVCLRLNTKYSNLIEEKIKLKCVFATQLNTKRRFNSPKQEYGYDEHNKTDKIKCARPRFECILIDDAVQEYEDEFPNRFDDCNDRK